MNSPKPKDAPKGPPKNAKGKSKGKPGKPMSVEEKAMTPCIFHQMPNGCVHGDKCHYSHVNPPPAKPKDSKADSKAKPKSAATKVAAAAAIVAALSSMVTPFQAIGTFEWAADTGAGRHLVSYEAVQEQGYHSSLFSGFANDSHEKLNFSTGGGFKKSSNTIGFQDQDGIFGDANHFLLDSCPMVRSIGLDVEQNFVEPLFLKTACTVLVQEGGGIGARLVRGKGK